MIKILEVLRALMLPDSGYGNSNRGWGEGVYIAFRLILMLVKYRKMKYIVKGAESIFF